MNIDAYAVIPFLVTGLVAFIYTATLTLRVLSEYGVRQFSVYTGVFVIYGILGFLSMKHGVIGNALATFLTLFAALLSRAYSLAGAFSEYKCVKTNSGLIPGTVKGRPERFIEILPDIILTVLLFVVARDIRERFNAGPAIMAVIYLTEVLYAMVVFAYVGTRDMIEKITEERTKGMAK